MIAKRPHWRGRIYAADAVTWAKWAGHDALELWQLVALHSGLDPDSLGVGSVGAWSTLTTVTFFDNIPVHPPVEVDPDDPLRRLVKNLGLAVEAFERGALKEYVNPHELDHGIKPTDRWMKRVAVSDFHAWSLHVHLAVVDGWPSRPTHRSVADGPRWPWGSHETKLLRDFAEIAEHWRLVSEGGPHVPGDDSTVPKAEVIEPLLAAKGISQKVRQAMFTILKPDGLKPGPRRRRRRVLGK